MKRIITLLVTCLLGNVSIAQNAFYEAQYLAQVSIADLNAIIKDREEIIPSSDEDSTVANFIRFIGNPFDPKINSDFLDFTLLKSAIVKYNIYQQQKDPFQALKGGKKKGVGTVTGIASLIPGLIGSGFSLNGGLQTVMIDGLTKYYAEEFRKAQLVTYMMVFDNTIGRFGELQVLFPQTYSKLKHVDPSKFPELGDEYKMLFNEDLRNIATNVIRHIDTYSLEQNDSIYKILNAANVSKIRTSDPYQYFKFAVDIGSKLTNNIHPVELLDYLDSKYYPKVMDKNNLKGIDTMYLTLHGINLLQRNLLDTTKSQTNQFSYVWVNPMDLKELDKGNKWKYFAGLLYHQDKDFFDQCIFQGTGKSLTNITAVDIDTLKTIVRDLLIALTEVKDFRANLNDENMKENYLGYMKLITSAINKSYFIKIKKSSKWNIDYQKIADLTMSIYDNARRKDYNNTLYYLISILKELKTENSNELFEKMEKYGKFMADVVNADDSDQVKEVIKKHAAPPTSFILKREYPFTISFTGQPGYFVAMEKLNGPNQKLAFVSGITLPLGFEFSFKTKPRNKENRGSINVFAQLIDIGAILNFRISDSTSLLPDKVNFEQLFSPGGTLSFGFKNSPLTVGIGYQYTPKLREVTQDGNQIYPNGHRLFLRAAWDIPLINIVKSGKKDQGEKVKRR